MRTTPAIVEKGLLGGVGCLSRVFANTEFGAHF